MTVIRIHRDTWDEMDAAERMSESGVTYSPSKEMTYTNGDPDTGVWTGYYVMAHPELQRTMDKIAKIEVDKQAAITARRLKRELQERSL